MSRAHKHRATATAFTMCVAECMRCGNSSDSALEVARRFMRAYSVPFYTSGESRRAPR